MLCLYCSAFCWCAVFDISILYSFLLELIWNVMWVRYIELGLDSTANFSLWLRPLQLWDLGQIMKSFCASTFSLIKVEIILLTSRVILRGKWEDACNTVRESSTVLAPVNVGSSSSSITLIDSPSPSSPSCHFCHVKNRAPILSPLFALTLTSSLACSWQESSLLLGNSGG